MGALEGQVESGRRALIINFFKEWGDYDKAIRSLPHSFLPSFLTEVRSNAFRQIVTEIDEFSSGVHLSEVFDETTQEEKWVKDFKKLFVSPEADLIEHPDIWSFIFTCVEGSVGRVLSDGQKPAAQKISWLKEQKEALEALKLLCQGRRLDTVTRAIEDRALARVELARGVGGILLLRVIEEVEPARLERITFEQFQWLNEKLLPGYQKYTFFALMLEHNHNEQVIEAIKDLVEKDGSASYYKDNIVKEFSSIFQQIESKVKEPEVYIPPTASSAHEIEQEIPGMQLSDFSKISKDTLAPIGKYSLLEGRPEHPGQITQSIEDRELASVELDRGLRGIFLLRAIEKCSHTQLADITLRQFNDFNDKFDVDVPYQKYTFFGLMLKHNRNEQVIKAIKDFVEKDGSAFAYKDNIVKKFPSIFQQIESKVKEPEVYIPPTASSAHEIEQEIPGMQLSDFSKISKDILAPIDKYSLLEGRPEHPGQITQSIEDREQAYLELEQQKIFDNLFSLENYYLLQNIKKLEPAQLGRITLNQFLDLNEKLQPGFQKYTFYCLMLEHSSNQDIVNKIKEISHELTQHYPDKIAREFPSIFQQIESKVKEPERKAPASSTRSSESVGGSPPARGRQDVARGRQEEEKVGQARIVEKPMVVEKPETKFFISLNKAISAEYNSSAPKDIIKNLINYSKSQNLVKGFAGGTKLLSGCKKNSEEYKYLREISDVLKGEEPKLPRNVHKIVHLLASYGAGELTFKGFYKELTEALEKAGGRSRYGNFWRKTQTKGLYERLSKACNNNPISGPTPAYQK